MNESLNQPCPKNDKASTIGDDFWNYLIAHHERLSMRLNGQMDVVLEDGRHKPIILPNAGELTENYQREFFGAWAKFSDTLIRV